MSLFGISITNSNGDCCQCGDSGLFSDIQKAQHLYLHPKCAKAFNIKNTTIEKILKKENAIPSPTLMYKTPEDILDNEVLIPDRFGMGMKNGKLYYGVIVADQAGNIIPALYDGDFRIGADALKALGYNFGGDFNTIGSETWNRKYLKAYLQANKEKKVEPMSTKELLETIANLNRQVIWHSDDNIHVLVAAYIMASYMFVCFKQFPRMVFIGMSDSGKSTQTNLMTKLAINPIISADASKSFLFRQVEIAAGMVVIDNFDNIKDDTKNEFIQLYDTSFEEGRPIGRTEDEGKKKTPKAFRTYCPMVVNCVNSSWLHQSSSKTRTIVIHMETKGEENQVQPIESINSTTWDGIQHFLRIWALHNYERLSSFTPDGSFSNRQSDIAKPLLAILNDAGEEFYEQGKTYLQQCFEEYHKEDETSDESEVIQAVWDEVSANRVKGIPITTLQVKTIAELVLSRQSIFATDGNGRVNPYYAKELISKCHSILPMIKNLPYSSSVCPHGKRVYKYEYQKFRRWMKKRGYDTGDEGVITSSKTAKDGSKNTLLTGD